MHIEFANPNSSVNTKLSVLPELILKVALGVSQQFFVMNASTETLSINQINK